ncbi:hypothetical protein OHA25_03055 [Nonomuraea sp. NBC_00507]|uniref:hypothetical protein n=1 Tax=Nonomuraea sp. NBC_00507 TaxID=2976002 RepID=UPI002E1968B2
MIISRAALSKGLGRGRGLKLGRVLAVSSHRTPVTAVDGQAQSKRPVTAFPLVTGLLPLVWQVQGSTLRTLSRRFYQRVTVPVERPPSPCGMTMFHWRKVHDHCTHIAR